MKDLAVLADISDIKDLEIAINSGAEGIGLLRTEFLYNNVDKTCGEDAHYQAYCKIIEIVDSKPVIIRTFDGGNDVPLTGCWGIRYSMKHEEEFRSQLRAIIRSSVHGNVSIVFPGIADIEQFKWAKEQVEFVKNELKNQGIGSSSFIPLGMMMEIPSAVLSLDMLVHEVNFYVIDSDKLLQYIMAIDNDNPAVATLTDPTHPAMLRTIKRIVEGKPGQQLNISVCGRLVEMEHALPILIGIGIKKIAVKPNLIGDTLDKISQLDKDYAVRITSKALALSNSERIKSYIQTAIQKTK